MLARNLFKSKFFYNLRYLGLTSYNSNSKLYSFFYQKHQNTFSVQPFEESKNQELFELKDKSFIFSSTMLSQDFSELGSTDSFKENYPFTQLYAKSLMILKNKQIYLHNNSVQIKQEMEKCFNEIEKFIKVYESSMLLSSFLLDIQSFNNRLFVNPKKQYLKTMFVKNLYDTKEKMHEELTTLIQNYKIICDDLKDYPDWLAKFETEAKKLFAYSNVLGDYPEVYSIVQQQKIFK